MNGRDNIILEILNSTGNNEFSEIFTQKVFIVATAIIISLIILIAFASIMIEMNTDVGNNDNDDPPSRDEEKSNLSLIKPSVESELFTHSVEFKDGEEYYATLSNDGKIVKIFDVFSSRDVDFLGCFHIEGDDVLTYSPIEKRRIVIGKIRKGMPKKFS